MAMQGLIPVIALAVATMLVYAATPLAIWVAERTSFYDRPVGYKGHSRPTPYLGGAAVMGGFAVVALGVLIATGDLRRTLPLVGGVIVMWGVGTADDRRTVSPGLRVAFELALAVGLWALHLGWGLGLGSGVDLLVTAVWVVGVINAFNLFDNMDGAASTMALVIAGAVAALGLVRGDAWLTVTAAGLAGACLGFLPHNLASPARIFLGDGGSMPIGFAVASLVMMGASGAVREWQALTIGVMLVGIPVLDTTLVVVSRRRRGIPILTGGRDHLTHRARRRLRTARAVAVTLGSMQAMLAALAIVAVQDGATLILPAVLLYLGVAATAITVLEQQEARLAPAVGAGLAVPPAAPAWRRPAPWLIGLLGLGAGLSPLASGYYDADLWAPVGLGLVAMLTAGLIARPPRLNAANALLLAGLAGLGLWSLASSSWSPSPEGALVNADRWLVLAALAGVVMVLVRGQRRALLLSGGVTAGIAVVAVSVVARMLGHDPASLFLAGRLNAPLGYINGEGCVFAIGLWGFFALAEQRRAALAGAGAAGATLLGCLAVLSQSRGVALAVLISAVAVLAMAPGRLRRAWALLCVAAGIAAAAPALLGVYRHAHGSLLSAGVVHSAAWASLAASIAVGLVWALAVGGQARRPARDSGRRLASACLTVLALAALAVGAIEAGRITHTVRVQAHAFVHLAESTGAGPGADSRLFSGGGNRYDYWRIAWSAWRAHPLAGLGAGGYPVPYLRERTTTEDIRQPHSLELEALSELGLVGGALVLALIAGITLAAWRLRAAARSSGATRGLLVAGLGGAVAWLTQTSVDWMHLLPGVTAIALAPIVALTRIAPAAPLDLGPAEPASRSSWPRTGIAAAAAIAAMVAVAGAGLSRQVLSGYYRDRARVELAGDPAAALRDANRALRLDPHAVSGYYTQAAALAHFDLGAQARAAVERALRQEPSNYVTWALLGDLEIRLGNRAAARAAYAHARELNPLALGLRASGG